MQQPAQDNNAQIKNNADAKKIINGFFKLHISPGLRKY